METRTAARIGAGCGIVWPLALSLGRDGAFPVALAGLVLFVPFLAYVCTLLRSVEGDRRWLTQTAFAAGLMGMTLKVTSGVPEIAYRGIPTHSEAHKALEGLANGATIASLYPFALFTGVVAFQALRTRLLSRWLGVLTGVTSVSLAINGSFIHAATVPALLLFVVWSFVAGVSLFVREGWRAPATGAVPAAAS
jgi:hypothetical protein